MAGTDDFDESVRSLVDRTRAEDAVRERRRRAELRRQAAESGTFRGSLLDLGERGVTVSVVTGSGHRSRGRIVAVGSDFVELVDERTRRVLACLSAIAGVHVEPGATPTIGDRVPAGTSTLMDRLLDLVDTTLSVHTVWNETVEGRLQSVGSDLLVLATAVGHTAYLPRSGVTEVAVG